MPDRSRLFLVSGLLILCSVIALFPQPTSAATHCADTETAFFNCAVGSTRKIISLCGVMDTGQLRALQYRFGAPTAQELVYPPQMGAGSIQRFRYARYTRPLVTYLVVQFQNGGYAYELFADHDAERGGLIQRHGIRIRPPGKRDIVTEFVCRAPVTQRLAELEDRLPAAPDQ